ncbi:MAG TPA: hypoxanthine phosphoribosyltransferase [Nitrospirae bacterium]|nr:hypoxanthine phosphoribosyltransferase [Nitrospirota bacterium]
MITGKPFLTAEQIQNRVRKLAEQISSDYKGKEFVAVGILKGAFMFYSDLVKNIRVPLHTDFIHASSYVKTESSGEITIHSDLHEKINGRDVLLIDDIADTGLTLQHIHGMLLKRKPASLKICVFLDKKSQREADIKLDYVGYEIPDHYLVGYGLDYENKFRNLPYIAIFKESL